MWQIAIIEVKGSEVKVGRGGCLHSRTGFFHHPTTLPPCSSTSSTKAPPAAGSRPRRPPGQRYSRFVSLANYCLIPTEDQSIPKMSERIRCASCDSDTGQIFGVRGSLLHCPRLLQLHCKNNNYDSTKFNGSVAKFWCDSTCRPASPR